MVHPLPRALFVLVLASGLPACGGESPPTDPAAPGGLSGQGEVPAEALKARFEQIVAAGKAKDLPTARAIVLDMLPTKDELRAVLRPGPASDAWLAAYEGPTRETIKPEEAARMEFSDPTRTEIFVHAATTEALAEGARDTVAWKEFPGGMKRFARELAAPGRTWLAVEAREPGKESGTRYTCFTRVGERFVLVVKPWRAMPREVEPEEATPAEPSVPEGPR